MARSFAFSAEPPSRIRASRKMTAIANTAVNTETEPRSPRARAGSGSRVSMGRRPGT
jgi:hypothetical protein